MEHPLNAFSMIQRFLSDWQLIDELLLSTDSLHGQPPTFSTLTFVVNSLILFVRRKVLRFCWKIDIRLV